MARTKTSTSAVDHKLSLAETWPDELLTNHDAETTHAAVASEAVTEAAQVEQEATVDGAASAILEAKPLAEADPVAYEAARFERFKEDFYRLQLKHRYWLNFPGGAQVFNGDLFTRVKRQMYAAQAADRLERT